jgi:hypothetical protein
MREKLRFFGLRTQRRAGRLLALAGGASLLVVLVSPSTKAQGTLDPGSIEVTAYFETQLPPRVGAPVCLTGGDEPIGKVSRVNLLPRHDQYHDGWEVVMKINKREAGGITSDSIVSARPPEADRDCGGSREVFLDVNVLGGGSPIRDHAVLNGEVAYFAEIAYMVPRPWWQRAADFVIMDIGVIWVELIGGVVIVIAGATAVVIFVRRCARARNRYKEIG